MYAPYRPPEMVPPYMVKLWLEDTPFTVSPGAAIRPLPRQSQSVRPQWSSTTADTEVFVVVICFPFRQRFTSPARKSRPSSSMSAAR